MYCEKRFPLGELSTNVQLREVKFGKGCPETLSGARASPTIAKITSHYPNKSVKESIETRVTEDVVDQVHHDDEYQALKWRCLCKDDDIDYCNEILGFSKQREQQDLPRPNYMSKQDDLDFDMRIVLVDWLIEVCIEFNLSNECLFLACNYVDRFLSLMAVKKAKLQLLGATCLTIAAKYEEVEPPSIRDMCYITDDAYTADQFLRMERLILSVLNFRVSAPTSLFFADHYFIMMAKFLPIVDSRLLHLTHYLLELMLIDASKYLSFLPSIIAASGLAMALHWLGLPGWNSKLTSMTGYELKDLKGCIDLLLDTVKSVRSLIHHDAVIEKYSDSKYLSVAQSITFEY